MAPDSLPEPIAVANLVAGFLTRIGVSYVIGGSFASSVHGEPRSTNDVDMVADLHEVDIERLQRRMPVSFSSGSDPVTLFVDTAEDTILRKLEWYRRGGESSEWQWRDVAGIVNTQSSRLDRRYLREWALKLGVTDFMERALAVPDV